MNKNLIGASQNDLILIGALTIIALVPLAAFPFSLAHEKKIVVKVGGEIVRELSLTAEENFTVEAGGGKNILEVKDGAVRVAAADCPDKICVKRGAIKDVGEVIACAPHKVLIEIAGD